MVDLKRGVGDVILLTQQLFQLHARGMAVGRGLDQHMRRQGGLVGGDHPNVQVMDVHDGRLGEQMVGQLDRKSVV